VQTPAFATAAAELWLLARATVFVGPREQTFRGRSYFWAFCWAILTTGAFFLTFCKNGDTTVPSVHLQRRVLLSNMCTIMYIEGPFTIYNLQISCICKKFATTFCNSAKIKPFLYITTPLPCPLMTANSTVFHFTDRCVDYRRKS
jgi:hypothetical protein